MIKGGENQLKNGKSGTSCNSSHMRWVNHYIMYIAQWSQAIYGANRMLCGIALPACMYKSLQIGRNHEV